MNTYRITFVNNDVIACDDVTSSYELDGTYHYEHIKGKLIYAIVKAESESEACTISRQLVKEVQEKIFGTDFVN